MIKENYLTLPGWPRRDPGKIKWSPISAGWLTSHMNTYFYEFLKKGEISPNRASSPLMWTAPNRLLTNAYVLVNEIVLNRSGGLMIK